MRTFTTYSEGVYPRLAHVGSVTIPTYGVVTALGLVLALLLSLRSARLAGVSEDRIWNLGLFTAFGTLLLSRAVLLAQIPRAFLTYPLLILTLPTVTRFGLLLAAISGALYIAGRRMPWLRTLDAVAPPLSLLSAFLHLGSLFAGDDLGTATASPLGRLIPGDEGHHPVALYAAVAALLIAGISLMVLRNGQPAGEAFGLALALTSAARFVLDELRPLYLLPSGRFDLLLRADQILLLLLTVAGSLFFIRWRSPYAQ